MVFNVQIIGCDGEWGGEGFVHHLYIFHILHGLMETHFPCEIVREDRQTSAH